MPVAGRRGAATREHPLRIVLHLALRVVLLVVFATGCSDSQPTAPRTPPFEGDVRVLFIGNSLTYTNDLPLVLEALADSAGGATIRTESFAAPALSLEDHWEFGGAQQAIALGGWDVVVLQQGPSALESSRVLLLDYAQRFDGEIRKVSARPALYSVWPSADRLGDFPRVAESYRLAAEAVNGMYFPVTQAWQATWHRRPDFPLYGGDQFHPTAAATYLAALVMYDLLLARSPVGLPRALMTRSGRTVSLSAADASLLQAAAAEAVARFGKP